MIERTDGGLRDEWTAERIKARERQYHQSQSWVTAQTWSPGGLSAGEGAIDKLWPLLETSGHRGNNPGFPLLPPSDLFPEPPTGRTQLEVSRSYNLHELAPAGPMQNRFQCKKDPM